MPEIKFDSQFLKLGVNVEEGDGIRFLDSGAQDLDGKWIFMVGVIPQGFSQMTKQKKFQLGKKNFDAVSAVYGTNSDNWKGKDMEIKEVTVNNPSTGKDGPSIRLVAPGGTDPEVVKEILNH